MLELITWIIILMGLILIGRKIYQTISQFSRHKRPMNPKYVSKRAPTDLHRELHYMDNLNGYEFEDYTAWLLKWNGFVGIKQTGKNHDFGLDVLAYRNHQAYGFQCKHYKNRKIKRQVIKHTADGAHFYRTQHAVVITNTHFSSPAVRAHKFFHVELWDRNVLSRLIQKAISNYQISQGKFR